MHSTQTNAMDWIMRAESAIAALGFALRNANLAEAVGCAESVLEYFATSILTANDVKLNEKNCAFELFWVFSENYPDIVPPFVDLLEQVQAAKQTHDPQALTQITASLCSWGEQVKSWHHTQAERGKRSSINEHTPVAAAEEAAHLALLVPAPESVIDISGELCPIQFVRAKAEILRRSREDKIWLKIDAGLTTRNVTRSLQEWGATVFQQVESEDHKTLLLVGRLTQAPVIN